MRFAAVVLLFAVAVQASSDADYWIAQAKANAEKDIDKFDPLMKNLSEGKDVKADVATQLGLLECQITDVDTNNKQLVPRIEQVVNITNSLIQGTPNCLQKLAFKALVATADGPRDNKSYYLLDGVQNWVALRSGTLTKYAAASPAVKDLQTDLTSLQKSTIALRDELDGMAQKLVQAIKTLHTLSADIDKNLPQIQAVATQMAAGLSGGPIFLANSAKLVAQVDSLHKKYQ